MKCFECLLRSKGIFKLNSLELWFIPSSLILSRIVKKHFQEGLQKERTFRALHWVRRA